MDKAKDYNNKITFGDDDDVVICFYLFPDLLLFLAYNKSLFYTLISYLWFLVSNWETTNVM